MPIRHDSVVKPHRNEEDSPFSTALSSVNGITEFVPRDMADKIKGKKSVQFNAEVTDHNVFNTSSVGLTPAVNRLTPRYKMPEERSAQAQCVAPPSSITRPNFEGTY